MTHAARQKRALAPARDERGYFLKGVSGNPGGRSRDSYILAEAARQHGPAAVATLASLMLDKKQSGTVRLGAAVALLDRGFGKPAVTADVTVSTGDPGQLHLEALRALAAMGCDSGDGAGSA